MDWVDPIVEMLEALNRFFRAVLYLPVQASTLAPRLDTMHYVQITFYAVFGTLYMVVLLWFLVRFRRRGTAPLTPQVTANGLVIGYAAAVLAVFLGFWLFSSWQYVTIYRTPPGAERIYVVGRQWMWKFAYPGGARSVGILYVPVGRPVELMLTSRDVVHSLHIPAFRFKRDAVPGVYTAAWFEATRAGSYPLMCSELCGTAHAHMEGRVIALEPADYDRWLGLPPAGLRPRVPLSALAIEPVLGPDPHGADDQDALMGPLPLPELGRQAAALNGCLRCHTTDGQPHIGPTWLHMLGRLETLQDGERVLVDVDYVTRSMMRPSEQVVAGFEDRMPSYFGRIREADTAAIVELMEALRYNQPPQGLAGEAGR